MMSDENVVPFTGVTSLDIDPAMTLREASKVKFQRVLVIGLTDEDDEYISCSCADGGTFLWDIERAKLRLLRMADDE